MTLCLNLLWGLVALAWLPIELTFCARIDGVNQFADIDGNCGLPLYGPYIRGTPEQQKESLMHWTGLPKVPYEEMTPLPAFMMMVYHSLAFPKAWKLFFKQADEGAFRLIIHTKMPADTIPEFFKKYLITNVVSTSHCGCVGLVMYMMRKLMEDPKVSHFVLLSGDSLPVKPMKHILMDLADDTGSRFCIDEEISRAETFFSMRRDLATFYTEHLPELEKMTETLCPDEDLFYWGAYLRGERVANSCIFLSDWTDTPKYWQANARRCDCPKFLASPKTVRADCGHPAVIGNVSLEALMEVADSPAGYWFIRKFPGDAIPGKAFMQKTADVIGGVNVKVLEGQLLDTIATRLLRWKAKKGVRKKLMSLPIPTIPLPVSIPDASRAVFSILPAAPHVEPPPRQALDPPPAQPPSRQAPEPPNVGPPPPEPPKVEALPRQAPPELPRPAAEPRSVERPRSDPVAENMPPPKPAPDAPPVEPLRPPVAEKVEHQGIAPEAGNIERIAQKPAPEVEKNDPHRAAPVLEFPAVSGMRKLEAAHSGPPVDEGKPVLPRQSSPAGVPPNSDGVQDRSTIPTVKCRDGEDGKQFSAKNPSLNSHESTVRSFRGKGTKASDSKRRALTQNGPVKVTRRFQGESKGGQGKGAALYLYNAGAAGQPDILSKDEYAAKVQKLSAMLDDVSGDVEGLLHEDKRSWTEAEQL